MSRSLRAVTEASRMAMAVAVAQENETREAREAAAAAAAALKAAAVVMSEHEQEMESSDQNVIVIDDDDEDDDDEKQDLVPRNKKKRIKRSPQSNGIHKSRSNGNHASRIVDTNGSDKEGNDIGINQNATESLVREAHAEVTMRRNGRLANLLKTTLKENRDSVLHKSTRRRRRLLLDQPHRNKLPNNVSVKKSLPFHYFPRLPSNSSDLNKEFPSFLLCQPTSDNTVHSHQHKRNRGKSFEKEPHDEICTDNDGTEDQEKDRRSKSSDQTTISSKKSITVSVDSGEDFGDKDNRTSTSTSSSSPHIPSEKINIQSRLQPSNQQSQTPQSNSEIAVRMRRGRSTTVQFQSPPLYLEGTHRALPLSTATIFLKTYYSTEDEKDLTYVPYFGDDDGEDVVSELFNIRQRQRAIDVGPGYVERNTNEQIDEILRLVFAQSQSNTTSATTTTTSPPSLKIVCRALSELMGVNEDRIKERYKKCFAQTKPTSNKTDSPNKRTKDDNNENSHNAPSKNSSTTQVLPYIQVMDSFRNLFCRRCFTYDCNIHGNLTKPNLELQGELAVLKEKEGHWDSIEPNPLKTKPYSQQYKEGEATNIDDGNTSSPGNSQNVHSDDGYSSSEDGLDMDTQKELTPLQKSICERAFLIFRGDIEQMAAVLGVQNKRLVSNYVLQQNIQLKDPKFIQPERQSNDSRKRKRGRTEGSHTTSMKNYNPVWLRRVQCAEIHPFFLPCDHDEPCDDDTCSCVQNAFFCTKHCVWGPRSRNFFRGCACRGGRCNSKSCPCFAARRECDPDLCRTCGACSDPPNQPAVNQRCRNDNVGMRRHCHLLVAESSIKDAGWGIYTKHGLKRGDFVHEYVGEVISQEEAERRGRIYDKVNRSYLFNLCSDYVVDASRKGNKTKFANHSSKPNCYTRMLSVNGDARIALFAKDDIEPQSELFFDYRYDVSMDNDLIVKAGMTVDWMKNPKMANKISKKHA